MSEEFELESQLETESREKILRDQEKHDFEAIEKKNGIKTRDFFSIFISSFISFLILLLGAYFSSKAIIQHYDYIDSESIRFEGENLPPTVLRTFFDDNQATFPKDLDYSSQIINVFDLTANRSIFSKNPDQKTLIASLTKLASSNVIVSSINMENETEINEEIEKIDGSALQLKKGQKFKNIDLVKAAIIASSNQGIFAVNNPEDTVQKMNTLASALHLPTTNFANPAGFDDDNNYSTASEFVQIAKLFFKNPILKEFSTQPKAVIHEISEDKEIKISNTNDLIRLDTNYVIAGKTGTTPKAGQNLLLLVEKNSRQYIVILLNGADRYKDAYKILDRLP